MRKDITEKIELLGELENILGQMEQNRTYYTDTLAEHEKTLTEYQECYNEDYPIEDDWRYKDYLQSIARYKAKISAMDTIAKTLEKLI